MKVMARIKKHIIEGMPSLILCWPSPCQSAWNFDLQCMSKCTMSCMGLWICSKSNIFVHANSVKFRAEETTGRWDRTWWVYVTNHNHGLPIELESPDLSTLHFGGIYPKLDIKISTHFFKSQSFMHRLKVLIIHFCGVGMSRNPSIDTRTFGTIEIS